MNPKKLKLDKPCAKKWSDMSSNEKGAYCGSCSKNIVDFTQLSPLEISEKMKQSKENLCARISSGQLNNPLPESQNHAKINFPYSKVAAGIMIVGSLNTGANAETKEGPLCWETIQIPVNFQIESNASEIKQNEKSPIEEFVILKGKIVIKGGEVLENAKISYFSVNHFVSSFSDEDGEFNLKIPKEWVGDKNVIRISFDEIVQKTKYYQHFEQIDFIYDKTEINQFQKIEPIEEDLLIGEVEIVEINDPVKPIVIENGLEVKYKDYLKAYRGKKSKFSLRGKETHFFYDKVAEVIYGKETPGGLILVFNKL